MESPIQSWYPQKLTIVLFLFCISFSSVVEAITSSSMLDQPVVSQPTDTEIRCECGDPLPPPPPPPPLLPLPEYSSPSPQNCNPPPPPPPSPPPRTPPPPRFIYVTSMPWDEHSYSAAPNKAVGLLVLAGLGAVSVTTIFG